MGGNRSDDHGGEDAPRELPVVLVTGVPRSGTTMLGELAVRYLHVAAINEGDFELWLLRQASSPTLPLPDERIDAILRKLVRQPFFDIVFDEVLSGGRPSPAGEEIVALLRERLPEPTTSGIARAALWIAAEHLGSSFAGHEDPRLHPVLARVVDLYPGARVIHIVRDPRDVACSVLRFPWGANNAVIAARDWDRDVRRARTLGARLGEQRYIEVRYEDVLSEPGPTLRRLMAFLGDVREHAVQRFVDETARNPLRANIGNWRTALSRRQLAGVESMAYELMCELGYTPALPRRRRPVGFEAVWQVHHRVVQAWRILSGRLRPSGAAHFVKNPHRSASEREQVE